VARGGYDQGLSKRINVQSLQAPMWRWKRPEKHTMRRGALYGSMQSVPANQSLGVLQKLPPESIWAGVMGHA